MGEAERGGTHMLLQGGFLPSDPPRLKGRILSYRHDRQVGHGEGQPGFLPQGGWPPAA